MNRFPFSWAGDRTIERGDCQPANTAPLRSTTAPAGFAAPAGMQIPRHHRQRLSRTAKQVLNNPHLMRRVSDRVYALWEADQRRWRDRDQPSSNFQQP